MRHIWIKNRLIILFIASTLFLLLIPDVGQKALTICTNNLVNFAFSLTPIFIIIGLLDAWIDKETMTKIAGKESGIKVKLISFLLGIVTAVPLYALLPVAGMLLKKGSTISNVLLFICACTSMRIPLLLFEASSFGWKYTAVRLAVNLTGILIITLTINKLLTKEDRQKIYRRANEL